MRQSHIIKHRPHGSHRPDRLNYYLAKVGQPRGDSYPWRWTDRLEQATAFDTAEAAREYAVSQGMDHEDYDVIAV
jgi:hypothetical protein